MRVFIMLRGIPGVGKSTWVKENNLENYTIESDTIRKLITPIKINNEGKQYIPQKKNKATFHLIDAILEERMRDGELVVLDATNISKDSYRKYKKMSSEYKYRFYIVDFTPNFDNEEEKENYIQKVISQDNQREEYKRVGEHVIRAKINQAINKDYINEKLLIKPNEIDKIYYKPVNLDNYNKINVISDIHGSIEELKQAIPEIKEDEFYIFAGDYVDRGTDSGEVINFMYNIVGLDNVVLIKGNHERWLDFHYQGKIDSIRSREYRNTTLHEIERIDDWKKKVGKIVNSLHQLFYFEYDGIKYLVSHAGVNNFDERIITYSENELLQGDRGDLDGLEAAFNKHISELGLNNVYQIHGHISNSEEKTEVGNVININSRVEFGGDLILLEITRDGREYKRFRYNLLDDNSLTYKEKENQLISALYRDVKNISVKENADNIDSLNFNKGVFFNRIWNKNTILARGLFYDKQNERIVARGYKKFFNYGENSDISEENIKEEIENPNTTKQTKQWLKEWETRAIYPLSVYLKENGFLGLLSKYNGKIYVGTKSKLKELGTEKIVSEEDYAHVDAFNDILLETLSKEQIENLLERNENYTLLFEVMDIEQDRHTVEYDKSKIILIDAIENTVVRYNRKSYEELQEIAKEFNLEVKEKIRELKTQQEMVEFVETAFLEKEIEGYVVEDLDNNMFKVKTKDYQKWRKIKRFTEHYVKTRKVKKDKDFIDFFKNSVETLKEIESVEEINMWELRKQYLNKKER